MKTKTILLLLAISPSIAFSQEEKMLIEYFSFLAKETILIEENVHIKSTGKPIIYKIKNNKGEQFYTITSELPKYGCFSVVVSHNKRKMGFLSWEGRWRCDNVEKRISHYKKLNGKEFRPIDLL